MLNDIISLFIALWAIKKAGQTEGVAAKYTYVQSMQLCELTSGLATGGDPRGARQWCLPHRTLRLHLSRSNTAIR